MTETTNQTSTPSKTPSHVAYQVRDREGRERLLDKDRQRLGTQRRQGLQHPA